MGKFWEIGNTKLAMTILFHAAGKSMRRDKLQQKLPTKNSKRTHDFK